MKRLLSPAPFILKGEGWYVTDYPSESRKKALESEKGGGTPSKKEPEKTEAASKSSTETPSSSSPSTGDASAAPSKTTSAD